MMYDTFISLHKQQLDAMGLSVEAQQLVAEKILSSTFDASEAFDIIENEERERFLRANRDIQANDVFLVDHALSFTENDV